MEGCILTLDVGGTFVKHALLLGEGRAAEGTVVQTPACARQSAAEALASFTQVVSGAKAQAQSLGLEIQGMAVAFPGPFDYDRGIPLMKHKFQALYGQSITPALSAPLPGVPVVYLHDSTAFLLGEKQYGAARNAASPAGMMLGTGLGFACAKEGRIRVSPDQRPAVRLWDRPFRSGIAEDALSARGVASRYAALAGESLSAKEVALRARNGDLRAIRAYRELGQALGEVLGPVLDRLNSDLLVVGGQVARSADLFLPYAGLNRPAVCAADLDAAALKGAYAYFRLGRARAVETVAEP